MTFELLERDWLSLRYWLLSCVLPTSSILVLVLLIMRWISTSAKELNHSALIVGFFALVISSRFIRAKVNPILWRFIFSVET